MQRQPNGDATTNTAKDDREVKGVYVVCVLKFIDARYDAATRQAILADVPPETRAALAGVNRVGWYPLHYVTDLFAAIAKHSPKPDEDLVACGMSVAEDATNTFLKLLMKLLSANLFARKFPEFWQKYHRFGSMTPDLSEIDRRHIVFHVTGYDYMHFVGAGWVQYVFDQLGKKGTKVTSNCPPGQRAVPEVIWDVRWEG